MQAAADLFQGSRVAIIQAEAHFENVTLSRSKLVQDRVDLFAADQVEGCLRGRRGGVALDEVGKLAIVLLSDWRLERERLHGDSHYFVYTLNRDFQLAGQLIDGGLALQLLTQPTGGL